MSARIRVSDAGMHKTEEMSIQLHFAKMYVLGVVRTSKNNTSHASLSHANYILVNNTKEKTFTVCGNCVRCGNVSFSPWPGA